MRVAALGRTSWLRDGVGAVAARGHSVVLIGTAPAAPEYAAGEEEFRALACRLGCPFFCGSRVEADLVRAAAADVAISVNWPTVIPGPVLALFPRGIVNAHFGDLPRFRGNATPNWAILAGEDRVVVTLHAMVEELDAGPILLQREIPLGPDTYIADIYEAAGGLVPEMFVEALDRMQSGTLRPRPQDDRPGRSLRCLPRRPSDGLLDWRRAARDLARLVRASGAPFAGATTHWGPPGRTETLIVWRARAAEWPHALLGVPGQVVSRDPGTGEVAVLTGDGLLILQEIEVVSRGRQRPADVLRSTRARLGMDPAEELAALRTELARMEARVRQLEDRG